MAAIYMWFENDLVVLTTTLYPIEVTDYLQLGIDIGDCRMDSIPLDEADYDGAVTDVILNQVLIAYGPNQDEADIDGDVTDVLLNQVLISYGPPPPDEADYDGDVIDVVLLLKLVTADTPDEKLQLDCDIYPPGCSMTP